MSKDYEDDEISEYGNWNTAADYSKLKIMKPLFLADEYETIATFGSIEFFDNFVNEENIDTLKLRGFKRLVKTLILIISNSKFAMRRKGTLQTLEGFEKELKRIYKIIPTLHKNKKDQRSGTSKLALNQEVFTQALEKVSEIKALMNEPLNKNDLIFTYKELFDPIKEKKRIWDLAVNQG